MNINKLKARIGADPILVNHISIHHIDNWEQPEKQISEVYIKDFRGAMEYLQEHDPTLNLSIEMAGNLGLSMMDVDSIRLAEILLVHNLTQRFNYILSLYRNHDKPKN